MRTRSASLPPPTCPVSGRCVWGLGFRVRWIGCRVVKVKGAGFDGSGYHESRGCSGDTYPESYITKYSSIRRLITKRPGRVQSLVYCVVRVRVEGFGCMVEG